MSVILLALLVQDTIGEWKFQVRQPAPESGQQEIVARIVGKQARLIDVKKKIFEATGVSGEYYTEPARNGRKSEKVTFSSGRGRYDHTTGKLELTHGVRLVREGDATVLEAPAAFIDFRVRYQCVACTVLQDEPGDCPGCGKPLSDRKFTHVQVDEAFTLKRPEPFGELAGEGLQADDALRELTVARRGQVRIEGEPRRLTAGGEPVPDGPQVITSLLSTGPLTVREPPNEPGQIVVTALESVRITRVEGGRKSTVLADSAEVVARRETDPKTGKAGRVRPLRLNARGNLTLTEEGPERSVKAQAETLEWQHLDGPRGPVELAGLTGKPFVTAESGPYRIRSRVVTIDRITGVAVFEEEVETRLVRSAEPGAEPVLIRSGKVTARLVETPQGPQLDEVEASRDVQIEGLVEGDSGGDGGRALADRFRWNLSRERGILEGRPFVRILQGGNTILAPRVAMEGRHIVVLKGPKWIRLVQPAEEGGERVTTVASVGDVVLDSSGGRTTVTIPEPCTVRMDDVKLTAGRARAAIAGKGGGLGALSAAGRVHVAREADGIHLHGERLTYDPESGTFTLIGVPRAVAEAAGREASAERIRMYEAAHPLTGETVKFTEMIGGRERLRILLRPAR